MAVSEPQSQSLSWRDKILIAFIVAIVFPPATILLGHFVDGAMWLDRKFPVPTSVVFYAVLGWLCFVLVWTWIASIRDRIG
jgi:hypothetical protein